MKKIFFSLIAVAALASCAKTEAVYMEDQAEIKIKPATALATKANVLAAIDGTEYPVAENFDVYGYWANQPAGSSFTNQTDDVTVYLGKTGAVEFTNKGNYWGGTTTYYWPKNGSLRFAAYSPSNVNMAHDLDTDTYTVEGYIQPATTATTWDFLVAPTSKSYTAMTAAENVSVVFEHALSWITVKVVAKDAEAAKAFDIKKVTINDVVNVADFTAVMSGEKSMTWELTDTTVPYVVYEGSQAVTETATVIETTANGTVIIPQPTTTITVDYTQNALEGTPALDNQQVTVDLVLDAEDTPWKPGKHYVYTLVFGLDEILINPDVVDWEDVIVNEVEVGTTNVYSVAQLEAALAQGGHIVLQENLATSTLTVAKGVSVKLDLAGKTITGTDATEKNYGLIQNNGALIIEDTVGGGKLTATATTNNGWNRYSAVISNNPGSTCTINGGTIEHLGGTDMSYAIDNLTNGSTGDVACVINGGTIKSTYRAVRQFLNSDSKKNDLIINGGTIEGANKAIFFHDPSKKANNGKLIVNDGQLTGGVYLYVTEGSTEWPVEVAIKADCVDAITTGNVPAGYAVVLVDGVYTVVKGATGVATAEEFAAAVKQTSKNVEIILNADIEVAIKDLGQQTGGSGEYKLAGEETENITIDLNGHKLTITTTYWSNLGAKNDNALFTIKNGTMDSSQPTGTWNSYDLTFSNCDYVIENVVFEKAIAFDNAKKAVTLKNVTINEDHDYYAMWITAAGQNVTIDGLTINSAGRGIKIDEQYVKEPAHVTLKVSNANFTTAKKAAILVKSVAGATITLSNVDITAVAGDSTNPVWVDADSAAYYDLVSVTGGTKFQEQ